MMNSELLIDQRISKASQALTNLIQSRSNSEPDRQHVLAKLKDLIADARKAQASFSLIARTLSDQGLKITKHDVAEFCHKQLGEKRTTRPKKKLRPEVIGPSKAVTDLETSKPNYPKPNISNTSQIQAEARPGFRVARDEDL